MSPESIRAVLIESIPANALYIVIIFRYDG